jgi:hypothetical protein
MSLSPCIIASPLTWTKANMPHSVGTKRGSLVKGFKSSGLLDADHLAGGQSVGGRQVQRAKDGP